MCGDQRNRLKRVRAPAAPDAADPTALAMSPVAPAFVAAANATRCAVTPEIGRSGTGTGDAPGTATGVIAAAVACDCLTLSHQRLLTQGA